MEQYYSVIKECSGELIEKKSRFIVYVSTVRTESEATDFLNKIREKHWDARHNVYAYVLKNGISKSSDDGEPHGTAGVPILNVIKNNNLFDTIIVVTRYFGGILLGTGGLLRAYSQAATLAISNSQIVTFKFSNIFKLTCKYDQYNKILSVLENFNAKVDESTFLDDINLKFHVQVEKTEDLKSALLKVTAGNLNLELLSSEFLAY